MTHRDHKYRAISIFTGAMGLDFGLELTRRFEVVACVELETAFCETIRKNKAAGRLNPTIQIFEGDIRNIDPHDVLRACNLKPGDVDVLLGGPPCQSFSTAGRRRTTQDPRGSLLWQFLRYVEVMEPKYFLMENVRGLLSAALRHRPIAERPEKGGPPLEHDEEPGSVVRQFSEDLQRIENTKYHMDCFEVNAVNYGAPQLRERALFVGNRFNSTVNFPDPTHGNPAGPKTKQASLFSAEGNEMLPWRTLRDAIGYQNDPGSVIMDFSPRKKRYLSKVPPGSNWRSLPVEMQQESMGRAWHAKGGRSGWWRRLSFDLPCPTLVTMPNHAGTALCHPTETRALTLREYALIQEFPRTWEFCGTPAQQYAQVGNAVPVRLGQVAGDVLAKELDSLQHRDWVPYDTVPDAYRVVYIQSHVRTRQWYKQGTTYLWKDGGNSTDAAYLPPQTTRKVTTI